MSLELQDPRNNNFIYLRFQRGVMHFDATTGLTQGLLLADYFKSILIGTNLPFDLVGPASQSRYYKQYDSSKPNWVARPADMPGSNLSSAFEREGPVSAAAVAPSPSGLGWGMQVHMFYQDQNRVLGAVRGAGFGWIKQQVRWSDIESSKGAINFGTLDPIVDNSSAQGVKVLFSVVSTPPWARADHRTIGPPDNPNDLADFMAALANRYRGKVQAYEVWNEQNFAAEWAAPLNPCSYVDLLVVVAPRIKAVDPSAIVVTGGLTPTGVNDPNVAIDDAAYLNQLYQCRGGAFKTAGDVVGVHATGYNNAPGDWVDVHTVNTVGFKNHPSFYFSRIFQLHDIMQANGDGRNVWVTEFHWGSAQPPVPVGYEWTTQLDEATVAGFFVQAIDLARQKPWIQAFFVWNLNFRTFANYHVNEAAIFGILNEDWSPRLIYIRLRDMPK